MIHTDYEQKLIKSLTDCNLVNCPFAEEEKYKKGKIRQI